MATFPNEDISSVRQRLLDGMKYYKDATGDECSYTQEDIDQCEKIVDAFLAEVAKDSKLSQQAIRDSIKKTVLDLNALTGS
jgi:hypothetical protein